MNDWDIWQFFLAAMRARRKYLVPAESWIDAISETNKRQFFEFFQRVE